MLYRFFSLTLLVGAFIFSLIGADAVVAQSGEVDLIDDPDGKFSLTVPRSLKPSDGWHAIESTDGLGRKQIEIVYKVREEGLLKIRRLDVEKGAKLADIVKRDESQTLTFLPGYTKGALEDFNVQGGKIPATLASYDFTQGGRPKMGRNYYLLVNETTVYILRYTGNRGTMGALRSQTDIITRSFKVK